MLLKVRLEKHYKRIEELKDLIKFYENKQCMFSSFQKLNMIENFCRINRNDVFDIDKKISKDEELIWNENVFKNLKRFNSYSLEDIRRHISPTPVPLS